MVQRSAESTSMSNKGSPQRVKNVKTFVVDASWRNFLFVKITTDDGLVGWGEGTLGWKEFAVEELIREFADRYVVGMDIFRIEDLWFKLYQIEHNVGPVMYSAMAGLETALWDLVGKACGQPVINLVGGKVRDRVKAYANGWYGAVDDLDRLQQQAEKVLALGYLALKLDPFGSGGREMTSADLRKAHHVVEAVRRTVGPDIDILIECHGRFSVGMALEAIRSLLEFRPLFFEEPIPPNNAASQGMVTHAAAAMGARVATGEHTYARYGFAELLSHEGAHVIQPDMAYSGGFMELKKIAALAEAGYVSVAPHNCDGPGKLAASVQLCANIPNFLLLETFADFDVPWRAELTIGGPKFEGGYYSVPAAPGWGFEIDEKVAVEHPGDPKSHLNMFQDNWERLMCN